MLKMIFAWTGILLISACNSNHKPGDLKLNNGEKWVVNAEMKPHIEQSRKILGDYLAENSTDYKKLAEDLKAQNSNLIKSCTMQGESHDQLHKWLHPHMELLEKLGEANDPKQAEAIVAQLDQSFKTYQNYFN